MPEKIACATLIRASFSFPFRFHGFVGIIAVNDDALMTSGSENGV